MLFFIINRQNAESFVLSEIEEKYQAYCDDKTFESRKPFSSPSETNAGSDFVKTRTCFEIFFHVSEIITLRMSSNLYIV